MSVIRIFTVIILLLMPLSCLQPVTRYPAEIKGLEDSKSFPLKAGDFKKGKMFMLSSDSFTVSYSTKEGIVPIEATFYFYTKNREISDQFKNEMLAIEQIHKSAELISNKDTILEKNGKKYNAKVAQYKIVDVFRNKRQELYSELVLTENKNDFVKLRSTAPIESMKIAVEMNKSLMREVNWAP